MEDFSKYFTRKEFECKCGCGQDSIDHELVSVLDRLRNRIRQPIIVTSGNRCASYNKFIGGSDRSQHIESKAADFYVSTLWSPAEVFDLLEEWYPDKYGIGLYDEWVHLDVRPKKVRWDMRKNT